MGEDIMKGGIKKVVLAYSGGLVYCLVHRILCILHPQVSFVVALV